VITVGDKYVKGDIASALLQKSREIITSRAKVNIRDHQLNVA